MTPESFVIVLTAAGAFLATLGGGAKWLLAKVEARMQASENRENFARLALNDRLQAEIKELREELHKERHERAAEQRLFMRRIYQLESYIHTQPGIDLPIMEGWPPA